MARSRNPFTPTFGIVPPVLAGRDAILDEMSNAFEDGLGNPNLSTILVGARGTGKTALLSCVADEARSLGWIAVNVMASEGMLEDIIQQVAKEASQIVEPELGRRLTGVNFGQILGLEWALEERGAANWRSRMEALLDKLGELHVGLLITVDEVSVHVDEMVQLASTYQLFVREGRNVALVMAGLPTSVTDLVDDERVTFLRRARQRQIGTIGDVEIERALRKTVEGSGKGIEELALRLAVEASGGFAYMMQLVGYALWAESGSDAVIAREHALRGVRQAQEEFERGVLSATYRDMSKGDRAFARAMLQDTDESRLSEVASRLGRGTNYASTYKSRLLKQGVIEESGGAFTFALPFFREFLEAQAGA